MPVTLSPALAAVTTELAASPTPAAPPFSDVETPLSLAFGAPVVGPAPVPPLAVAAPRLAKAPRESWGELPVAEAGLCAALDVTPPLPPDTVEVVAGWLFRDVPQETSMAKENEKWK